MNYSLEDWKAIKPASWKTAGHIIRPDYKLLEDSLVKFGWLGPVVVRVEDKTIIDGYHRWVLAAENATGFGREIPVSWVDCDEVDAILLHVILNRTKGLVVNRYLSRLVKQLRRSKKYDDETLRNMMKMTHDEFELLSDGTLITMRKVKQHVYSKAWVPVETSIKDLPGIGASIERPPNSDE